MILSLIIQTFQLCWCDRICVRSAQLLEVDRRAWSPDFEVLEMSPLNPAAIGGTCDHGLLAEQDTEVPFATRRENE